MAVTSVAAGADVRRRQRIAERTLDVVGSMALFAIALPVVVVSAMALTIVLRTSPFFAQYRVGDAGRLFRFVKLRTLPRTAPAYADKYAIVDIPMPRIARWLRASHLDELPQLALVLLGRMRLVGPRPEMPHLHAQFAPALRAARERVAPGCTGLWQISVDNHRLISEAPEYDCFYAVHHSARLDVWVLWRTFVLAISGKRVTLEDVPRWAMRGTTAEVTYVHVDVRAAAAETARVLGRDADPVLETAG